MDSEHTLVLVRYRLMGKIIYYIINKHGGANPPISKTIIVKMMDET